MYITRDKVSPMYAYDQSSPSRRLAGIGFVALLHLAIVYALLTGLGQQVVEVLRGPIETRLLDDIKPPPPDAQPPVPKLVEPPPPYIPPPEINIRQPITSNAIVAVTREKPVEPPAPVAQPAPPPPPAPPVRVQPTRVASSCRTPPYPPASARLEETGTSTLRFLVDVDGRVAESQIANSSGHARLDEAARAALSLCRFTPGTVDGRPERSWITMRYVWKLD